MDKMLELLNKLFPDGYPTQTGPSSWSFIKGSAKIVIKLIKTPGNSWFLVDSVVMPLPKTNLLRFYHKLLELNGPATFGAFFNIRDQHVCLSMLRPVEGLETDEIEFMATIVAEISDKYDDELIQLFSR